MSAPLSPERLARAQEIADRASNAPFFVEDCEGSLSVWRESALVRVSRDERGEIVSWMTPSSYRQSDQIMEIDLGSWDPGEDAEDDVRRRDIHDLVDGRALVPALLAEVKSLRQCVADQLETIQEAALALAERGDELRSLRAELDARPSRAEVLRGEAAWLREIATPIHGRERTEHERGQMYAARRVDERADAAEQGEQEPGSPTPLYCGADLDRDEFPSTCYRRIGHDGACGPTTDVDAADREADRG